jgi:hypothetical protein
MELLMDNMDKPRIYVDFNEMLEPNLFLLSKDDTKLDSEGNKVSLREGMKVSVYSDDTDDEGKRDYLLAEAVVEKNTAQVAWAANVKWCCRIDDGGICHESSRKGKSE